MAHLPKARQPFNMQMLCKRSSEIDSKVPNSTTSSSVRANFSLLDSSYERERFFSNLNRAAVERIFGRPAALRLIFCADSKIDSPHSYSEHARRKFLSFLFLQLLFRDKKQRSEKEIAKSRTKFSPQLRRQMFEQKSRMQRGIYAN